ncbi:hypothetical protein [Rossellomorea vietnamensis]|uniref:hypothetical protein n=1 Tax=Rossellomorea vietnamensis TaxID=218284 RepID=UPI000550A694|nr:hypothetical protein [Rossellomorea vietnamensis]
MAKIFLKAYVAFNILIVAVNVIANLFSEETYQFLSNEDWLIFIVGCGALAICESIEKKDPYSDTKERYK